MYWPGMQSRLASIPRPVPYCQSRHIPRYGIGHVTRFLLVVRENLSGFISKRPDFELRSITTASGSFFLPQNNGLATPPSGQLCTVLFLVSYCTRAVAVQVLVVEGLCSHYNYSRWDAAVAPCCTAAGIASCYLLHRYCCTTVVAFVVIVQHAAHAITRAMGKPTALCKYVLWGVLLVWHTPVCVSASYYVPTTAGSVFFYDKSMVSRCIIWRVGGAL